MRKSPEFNKYLNIEIKKYIKARGAMNWVNMPSDIRAYFMKDVYTRFMEERNVIFKKKTNAEKAKSALRNKRVKLSKLKKRWQNNQK